MRFCRKFEIGSLSHNLCNFFRACGDLYININTLSITHQSIPPRSLNFEWRVWFWIRRLRITKTGKLVEKSGLVRKNGGEINSQIFILHTFNLDLASTLKNHIKSTEAPLSFLLHLHCLFLERNCSDIVPGSISKPHVGQPTVPGHQKRWEQLFILIWRNCYQGIIISWPGKDQHSQLLLAWVQNWETRY